MWRGQKFAAAGMCVVSQANVSCVRPEWCCAHLTIPGACEMSKCLMGPTIELGSRLIFRREGRWPFDEFHAMLKSLKFHWEFCFVCGDSWQKLFFFLFCKMRVNYCAAHQIFMDLFFWKLRFAPHRETMCIFFLDLPHIISSTQEKCIYFLHLRHIISPTKEKQQWFEVGP